MDDLQVYNSIKNGENIGVCVEKFGAVGNCVKDFGVSQDANLEMQMEGHDDTQAFKDAIAYCIANKKRLVLNGDKKYRIKDTLVIDGKLSIEGNYCSIFADIEDKEKPLFLIKGNAREKICNIHLFGNYICKSGIELQLPDNQMLTLRNLDISFFRYGIYSNQAECLNRMVIDRCEIMNNLLCGIYFNSNDGQSVPMRINDTILHTNGFGPLSQIGYVNKQKVITTEKRSDICQIYLVGIGNLLITGGQLTAGTDKGTKALLWGNRVSGLTMIDVETEQFCLAEENSNSKMDTSQYKNQIGGEWGGAIHIQNSYDINIQVNGSFDLHGDCFVKLINCYRIATIKNCYKGDGVNYLVDVVRSNYNYRFDGSGSYQLRLNTNCNLSDLSPNALFSIDKNNYNLLTNIRYLKPHMGADYNFTYSENNGSDYILKAVPDLNNPDFSGACYIKKICYSPSVILVVFDMNQYVNEGSGRFYIQYLDKDNNVIGYDILNPKDSWKAQAGNTFIKRFAIYPNNNNIATIKYGFINNSNTDGVMNDNSVLRLNGFKLYVGFDSPVNQWNDNIDCIDDENNSLGFIKNNMISWGVGKPSYGFHRKGEVVFNANPSSGGNLGWICTETNSNGGVWKTFGKID